MIFDKRIDNLVAKSYMGPYVLSFLIAQFVLVMQFLWQYIDDITGKGIGLFEILELVFLFSLTLVPKSIPITILLSSVFVFGNMSEKFELTSLKSAGVSFFRIIRVGIFMAVLTALFSVIASNMLVPKANFLFFKKFDAIRKQKPALVIEQGMFNEDFTGYKIYVGDKDKSGKNISNVKIYDQTEADLGRINLITAKHGSMSVTEDNRYFVMNLTDGEQYREIKEKSKAIVESGKKYPFTRTKFKSWEKKFDMSEFALKENNRLSARRGFDLLNTPQFLASIDSVDREIAVLNYSNLHDFNELIDIDRFKENIEIDSSITNRRFSSALSKSVAKATSKTKQNAEQYIANVKKRKDTKFNITNFQLTDIDMDTVSSFYQTLSLKEKKGIINSAVTKANHVKNQLNGTHSKLKNINIKRTWYIYKLNVQYSWAAICILFLFIGAPFGSIIRKGGYGFPLLMAIVFFMSFIILGIMGEKLMRADTLGPYLAAWLPNIVLIPFAVYFTTKAVNDSKLSFDRFFNKFS